MGFLVLTRPSTIREVKQIGCRTQLNNSEQIKHPADPLSHNLLLLHILVFVFLDEVYCNVGQ